MEIGGKDGWERVALYLCMYAICGITVRMPLQGKARAISTLNAYISPPSAIHNGTVFSDLESETCRVGLAASPPCVQDQKTMFSNAAWSNRLSKSVSLSSKNWSLSSLKEKKNRSIVKRLSNSP